MGFFFRNSLCHGVVKLGKKMNGAYQVLGKILIGYGEDQDKNRARRQINMCIQNMGPTLNKRQLVLMKQTKRYI